MRERRLDRLRRTTQERATKLEQGRRTGLPVAVGKRFGDIDGADYGGLMAIELFTTVMPLIILGFGYLSGFAENASVGNLFVRQLGLTGASEQNVRAAFGSSEALKSSWTVVGLAGFLIWGIPMALTVASMFAKAWQREPLSLGQRLWRGVAWFVLYLVTLGVRERIGFGVSRDVGTQIGFFVLSLVPVWLFWTVTPALLVRDGGAGKKFLARAGLAGVVIDGILIALATRIVFPPMLSGWTTSDRSVSQWPS